ncbi:AlpA family phage regulatory protein [Shewanella submarina]|uniref:Helix-turn-helix transcriptional regulator n=1 Tax=Shewanella submarina TaxID=2016376 RepID=A0ABV7GL64_9GAMM|nr:AlpA family phage regulatory protein [Shewanella submarina]MCL1039622.1 AlpA family phage regulatory protein [Shewanella submarina]
MDSLVVLVDLSESTIRRRILEGAFPQSVELSDNRVAWFVSDIEQWAASRR